MASKRRKKPPDLTTFPLHTLACLPHEPPSDLLSPSVYLLHQTFELGRRFGLVCGSRHPLTCLPLPSSVLGCSSLGNCSTFVSSQWVFRTQVADPVICWSETRLHPCIWVHLTFVSSIAKILALACFAMDDIPVDLRSRYASPIYRILVSRSELQVCFIFLFPLVFGVIYLHGVDLQVSILTPTLFQFGFRFRNVAFPSCWILSLICVVRRTIFRMYSLLNLVSCILLNLYLDCFAAYRVKCVDCLAGYFCVILGVSIWMLLLLIRSLALFLSWLCVYVAKPLGFGFQSPQWANQVQLGLMLAVCSANPFVKALPLRNSCVLGLIGVVALTSELDGLICVYPVDSSSTSGRRSDLFCFVLVLVTPNAQFLIDLALTLSSSIDLNFGLHNWNDWGNSSVSYSGLAVLKWDCAYSSLFLTLSESLCVSFPCDYELACLWWMSQLQIDVGLYFPAQLAMAFIPFWMSLLVSDLITISFVLKVGYWGPVIPACCLSGEAYARTYATYSLAILYPSTNLSFRWLFLALQRLNLGSLLLLLFDLTLVKWVQLSYLVSISCYLVCCLHLSVSPVLPISLILFGCVHRVSLYHTSPLSLIPSGCIFCMGMYNCVVIIILSAWIRNVCNKLLHGSEWLLAEILVSNFASPLSWTFSSPLLSLSRACKYAQEHVAMYTCCCWHLDLLPRLRDEVKEECPIAYEENLSETNYCCLMPCLSQFYWCYTWAATGICTSHCFHDQKPDSPTAAYDRTLSTRSSLMIQGPFMLIIQFKMYCFPVTVLVRLHCIKFALVLFTSRCVPLDESCNRSLISTFDQHLSVLGPCLLVLELNFIVCCTCTGVLPKHFLHHDWVQAHYGAIKPFWEYFDLYWLYLIDLYYCLYLYSIVASNLVQSLTYVVTYCKCWFTRIVLQCISVFRLCHQALAQHRRMLRLALWGFDITSQFIRLHNHLDKLIIMHKSLNSLLLIKNGQNFGLDKVMFRFMNHT